MANAPNSRKQLSTIEKRLKILELYDGGATVRQISEHLIAQGYEGCKPTSIFNHINAALKEEYEKYRLKKEQIVQGEIRRLEKVELAHLTRLYNSKLDVDAFEKMTRGMERIWKRKDNLLGINKPEKIEVTGADGGPLDVITRVILPAVPDETNENENNG